MRISVDIWQSFSDHRQSAFIGENLLPLGYEAWQGYLTHGRGMVTCKVKIMDATPVEWDAEYTVQYIPAIAIPQYLQLYHLSMIYLQGVMDIVRTYSPEQEILIAISRDSRIEVNWLRNMRISPPECHRQICNRWTEFELESNRRCNDGKH